MKLLRCLLASCLVVTAVHAADDKHDKAEKGKIVGVWGAKNLVSSLNRSFPHGRPLGPRLRL